MRLQELRGTYGIKSPAPICADPAAGDAGSSAASASDPATCQVIQAPLGSGLRLVPDVPGPSARPPAGGAGEETEIRLTYRELSALIEDAIRSLR